MATKMHECTLYRPQSEESVAAMNLICAAMNGLFEKSNPSVRIDSSELLYGKYKGLDYHVIIWKVTIGMRDFICTGIAHTSLDACMSEFEAEQGRRFYFSQLGQALKKMKPTILN